MEIDKIALLEYLEDFISENRKQRFLDVLKNRTKHFTIAMEDVYQMHNTRNKISVILHVTNECE